MGYRAIYRNIVLPAHCVLRRRSTLRWYTLAQQQQSLSLEDLSALQRRKLALLVQHCSKHVPYYRELFGRRGLDPACVEDLSALRQSGIRMGKEEVRAAGRALFSETSSERLFSTATSGSTGVPMTFYKSMDTVCRRQALKYRAEEWIGKPIGTRTTLIWGRLPPRNLATRAGRFLYWWYQNYQFLSAFDIGPDQLAGYVMRMTRFGAEFVESYVTAVHQMAKVMAARKIAPPPTVRGIIVGGEQLVDEQRRLIEASFGCAVYNRYGSSEFGNIASECAERCGLHINTDHLLVEVVDDNDEPVFDRIGEIVVTDLDSYDVPLLRYRIGDRGVLSGERCRCGRPFPMLESINGRVSERLLTRCGKEVHDMFFVHNLSRIPGVAKFQVVQKSLDLVQVDLQLEDSANHKAIAAHTLAGLKELDDYGIRVAINIVGTIPLTASGKLRHFVCEVPYEAREAR